MRSIPRWCLEQTLGQQRLPVPLAFFQPRLDRSPLFFFSWFGISLCSFPVAHKRRLTLPVSKGTLHFFERVPLKVLVLTKKSLEDFLVDVSLCNRIQ